MFSEILQLDPRPAARTDVLDQLRTSVVAGFEVTDPEYAAACAAGNFDPQHLGARSDLSSIEVVADLLGGKAAAATLRADLDSLGSMAVLDIAMVLIEQAKVLQGEIMERIRLIGEADRFERGGWPGVRPLPTRERPWFEAGGATETHALAAMAAVVEDQTRTLEERVSYLKIWLLTGEEPRRYRDKVETERLDMIAALEREEILVDTTADGKVATVFSTHRAGVGLGYHRAPVVVAVNPAFRFKGGEPHVKFTVAQFEAGYVDLGAALAELNEAEADACDIPLSEMKNRWGGSPTIGGSPIGESSQLWLNEVAEVVQQHLLG